MKDRNTVQLIGYVGADPVVKKFDSGARCATMRVGTHQPLKKTDKKAKQEYTTTWHTVVAWAQSADYAERNFLKGSHILVDASIRYRSFNDKAGVKQNITEIVAETLVNLDR